MGTKKFTNLTNGFIRILLKILLAVSLILLLLSILKVLTDCRYIRLHKTIVDQTGYLPDNENWDVIPDTIPPFDDDELDSLPKNVSLEAFFPPIGNQGSYGTCVAWATGYNLNTALNAIKNHWTPDQLENPVNQTSPKDLWMGVPSNQKGAFCGGTSFEPALNVLLTRGVANMGDVPYEGLGSCNGKFVGDSANVIASFKHIVSNSGGNPSVLQIKAFLNDTVPLLIAAHLGDRFMDNWDSDEVLSYDTYLTPNAMHAYHAMVLSGYDDGRNAFRVRNSWGPEWGDEGSIWVDYDFFISEFCTEVFIAEK